MDDQGFFNSVMAKAIALGKRQVLAKAGPDYIKTFMHMYEPTLAYIPNFVYIHGRHASDRGEEEDSTGFTVEKVMNNGFCQGNLLWLAMLPTEDSRTIWKAQKTGSTSPG